MSGDPQIPEESTFPFDVEFQKTLFRMLIEDDGFAVTVAPYIKPFFFENQILAWAWAFCHAYREQYGLIPGFPVLFHQVRQMDPNSYQVYAATLDSVRQASLRDTTWLKDQVLEFIKRNIFVRNFHATRTLFNSGKVNEAYDHAMRELEELHRISWENKDRSWTYGDFELRESRRQSRDFEGESIGTGFPWLDSILDGGLSKGEVGNWLAYPKIGKTTMLIQHGRAATSISWKKVYHAVLEGSRELVENRYDSCFAEEMYNHVKRGDMDVQKFEAVRRQYEMMRDLLVVEGFTERWDYTVQDISNALKDLRINYGWVPDLIIIDYGDLLNGRHQPYRDRLANEIDAFRDIKSLANRGYGIWTASQAQRPKEGTHQKTDLLMTRQIAGVYEKVRICDFLGTLNQNMEERRHKVMRLYAEIYRDNAAGLDLTVRSDLAVMRIEQVAGLVNPVVSDSQTDPSKNYQDGMPVKVQTVV